MNKYVIEVLHKKIVEIQESLSEKRRILRRNQHIEEEISCMEEAVRILKKELKDPVFHIDTDYPKEQE